MEETVLPQLALGSIIVIDNASIHHSQTIKELVHDVGHQIEYLPPYSLDFNPIEESFLTLKAWVKRHFELASTF